MKVLFATTNPAKIKYYAEGLRNRGVEVLTLKDISSNIEVEENGNSAIENASIKAKAYYDLTHITTIAIDDNLYIEGLNDDKQPSTHVRRVSGVTLDDDKMIEYYTGLVKSLGGRVIAKWVKGVVVYTEKGVKTFEYSRDGFYFIDTPSKVINEGYPLDSIAIIPEFNKYLSELSEEELNIYKRKNNLEKVFNFIIQNII